MRVPASRFAAPLHSYPVTQKDRPAATLHKTAGGSASRNGEARRKRAGKAEQSECRDREDYGWGWAGGATKPNHVPRSATTPPPKSGVTKPNQAPGSATTPHHTRGSVSASVSVSARGSASVSASAHDTYQDPLTAAAARL